MRLQLRSHSTPLLVGFVTVMLGASLVMNATRPLSVSGYKPQNTGTLLDINTASADDLALLSGIGPGLAQRIVEHREAMGGFTNVEQLQEVHGIGPVKLEQVRRWVVCAPTVNAHHEPSASGG